MKTTAEIILALMVTFSMCLGQTNVEFEDQRSAELEEFRKELSSLSAIIQRQEAEIQALKAMLESQAPNQQISDTSGSVAEVSPTLTTTSSSSVSDRTVKDETKDKSLGDSLARQPLGRFPDDAIVTAGEFDGSIQIPGTEASVRIGGFVRTEANFDFDNLGAQFSALPTTIPLDDSTRDGTNQSQFHVRNSRVNIDFRSEFPDAREFRTFVEWDFFGDGDEFSNGYDLRLRHAAVQYGNFYFGQWWSQFLDLASIPEAADLVGPLGSPTTRNPGIRYSNNINEKWRYGVGLENPAGDLSGDSALLASDIIPNVTGYLQFTDEWGHLRLSSLFLRLESTTDDAWAGGINFSGRINTPFLHPRDNLAFAVQAGSGFTHYYTGFSDRGFEGVVDSSGLIDVTEVLGGYAAYQHWWGERWRSTFAASYMDLSAGENSSPLDFKSGTKLTANLFWSPYDNVNFGVEFIYAERETFGGEEGSGSRIHTSSRFDF